MWAKLGKIAVEAAIGIAMSVVADIVKNKVTKK